MVTQKGFTIIELAIVVLIIAILAAIAYPNYQQYIIKTKRADMMTELIAMGGKIESIKLAQGSYNAVKESDYAGTHPNYGNPLYTTSLKIEKDASQRVTSWKLSAVPQGIMSGDGTLTYDSKGVKCRGTTCGTGDEWKN